MVQRSIEGSVGYRASCPGSLHWAGVSRSQQSCSPLSLWDRVSVYCTFGSLGPASFCDCSLFCS